MFQFTKAFSPKAKVKDLRTKICSKANERFQDTVDSTVAKINSNNYNHNYSYTEKKNVSTYRAYKPYPYLTLSDRLTQIWINQYTILVILIGIKVLLFGISLKGSLARSETYTINSCNLLDKYASNVMSMPHYTAKAANAMIAKSVEEANNATVKGLKLLLTGVESLIIFYIQIMVGTYACLLTAAVDTSVDVATNATKSVISFVNSTLDDVTDTIEDGLTDLSKVINAAESAGESIIDLFTKKETESPFDKVNLTISGLKNFSIPSSINLKLEKLAADTPDFDTVENKTKSLIHIPFNYVKTKLDNETFYDNTKSMLVPHVKDANFCPSPDKIRTIYTNVENDIDKVVKVILALTFICAILLMGALSYMEYRKWKQVRDMTTEIATLQYPHNKAEIYATIDQYTNRIPFFISTGISKVFRIDSTSKKREIRWFFAYLLSSPSMIILGIALAGILAVILQYIIFMVAVKCIRAAKNDFTNSSTDISGQIKEMVLDWTSSTNNYLNTTQASINEKLFGLVVEATDSVNKTISTFYDGINDELTNIFNGTVFEKPVKAVVKCVIGNKVEAVEKGLTWVHNNAALELPRVNETYLLLASNSENKESTSLSDKAVDMFNETILAIVKEYKKSLLYELVVSLILLGVFILQIIIAYGIFWLKKKNMINNGDGFGGKLAPGSPSLPAITALEKPSFFYDIFHNKNNQNSNNNNSKLNISELQPLDQETFFTNLLYKEKDFFQNENESLAKYAKDETAAIHNKSSETLYETTLVNEIRPQPAYSDAASDEFFVEPLSIINPRDIQGGARGGGGSGGHGDLCGGIASLQRTVSNFQGSISEAEFQLIEPPPVKLRKVNPFKTPFDVDDIKY